MIEDNVEILEGMLHFPHEREVASRFRRNLMSDIYWALKRELDVKAHEQYFNVDTLHVEEISNFDRSRFVKYHCNEALWNQNPTTFESSYSCDLEGPKGLGILWSVAGDTFRAFLYRNDLEVRSLHFVTIATPSNAYTIGGHLAYVTAGITQYLREHDRIVEGLISVNGEPIQYL